MKPIIHAAILAILLSASGCTSMLIGNALQQGKEPSPEQIEAYGKVGSNVFSCTSVKGPPPAGAFVLITAPKASTFNVKFGDNCQVLGQ